MYIIPGNMQGHLINRFALAYSQKSHLLNHRFSELSIYPKFSINRQTVYEKLNIPPKPKKPLTPYFKFLKQVRPLLTKEYPEMKATELVKVAAQRWSVLDSNFKEKLQQQYKNEIIDYSKVINEYEEKLTSDQKTEIKREKQHKLDVKEEKKTRKKSKELGRPKQPLTSFLRFLRSKENELTKYSNRQEWIKAMSQEWKTTNPEIKANFEEETAHAFSKWKKELDVWEAKMVKEGNLELVRSSSLLPIPKKKLKK